MATPEPNEESQPAIAGTLTPPKLASEFDVDPNRRFGNPYLISLIFLCLGGLSFVWADSLLANPTHHQWLPGDIRKFIGLAEAFAHGFGVFLISLSILFLAPQALRFIPRIMLCAFWPALIVQGIKIQFWRFRPIRFFDAQSVAHFPADQSETWLGWMIQSNMNSEYVSQSFPSGHAATAWGLAIGMTWAFPKGKWLFVMLAILASLQRIMVYAHWPSDVLVGTAIAFCFAGALTQRWGVGRLLDWIESYFDPDNSKEIGNATCEGDQDALSSSQEPLSKAG